MPDAGKVLGQSLTLPDIKPSFLCGVLDVRAHPCVSPIHPVYGKRIPYFIVLGASLTVTENGPDLPGLSKVGMNGRSFRAGWVEGKHHSS